jgi:hypothetical protein
MSEPSPRPAAEAPAPPAPLDLAEKGRRNGQEIALDRRLFMKFTAFGRCFDPHAAVAALREDGAQGAVYLDANDPQGIGVMIASENPEYFVTKLRSVFSHRPFADFVHKDDFDMLGRTYSIGYEQDLEETLVERPRRRVLDPALPWAIWYPLRRSGSFEQLSRREQDTILMEHGGVGMAFGRAGLGFDIRLACHGLDRDDNDFVVGLLGPELHPLSIIVQRMRKTKQTSLHLERLGPFFVGRVAWQSRT